MNTRGETKEEKTRLTQLRQEDEAKRGVWTMQHIL